MGGQWVEVLGEIDTEGVDDPNSDEGWVVQNQLGVVSMLGWTAAAHDTSYEDFQGTMEKPRAVVAATFSMSGPEFDDAMNKARSVCSELEAEDSEE